MAQDVASPDIDVADGSVELLTPSYDICIWAAGYEARSSWFVQSPFAPRDANWLRVEFIEDRDKLSAPENLKLSIGRLLGEQPMHRDWDGAWIVLWQREIAELAERLGRRIRVLLDYSSMPRTVYGPLLMECISGKSVESLTAVYVPGIHAPEVNGSRVLEGLRTIIGAEGARCSGQPPAYIIGLGYDGILAESIVEFFQIGHFSALYSAPGVTPDAESRVLEVNRRLLSRAELVVTSPGWACADTLQALRGLQAWYVGSDLIVIPLGPKPHVLAAIALAAADGNVALRFAQVRSSEAVQVTVPLDARPYVTAFRFPGA